MLLRAERAERGEGEAGVVLQSMGQLRDRVPPVDLGGAEDIGPPAPICGNGKLEVGEACDGDVTCQSLHDSTWFGMASCEGSCTDLNTDACRTKLGTEALPASSCAAIPSDGVDDPVGLFWIEGPDGPVQAWCDLISADGGWTLVSNRTYSEIPGAWGTFTEGTLPPTPGALGVLLFTSWFPAPTGIRLVYTGNGQSITRAVAPGASWESAGLGLRIQLAAGDYAIFSDQPATPGESVCITSGTFDTGYKCDGNGGQLQVGQGLFSAFAEDELCNCDNFAWKHDIGGCEASVCEPKGFESVYLR